MLQSYIFIVIITAQAQKSIIGILKDKPYNDTTKMI